MKTEVELGIGSRYPYQVAMLIRLVKVRFPPFIQRDTLEHSQQYIERHRKCSIRVYLLIAMFTRSRKADNSMKNYYIVIGAFVGVCVLSVLYVLLNPKKSFAQMPVIDDTAILVHNGQQGSAFQRGENQFFQVIYNYRRVIPCCVGLEFS